MRRAPEPPKGDKPEKVIEYRVINGVFRKTLKISELRMPSDVGQLALREFFCPRISRIYTNFRLTAKGVKSEKSEVSERL